MHLGCIHKKDFNSRNKIWNKINKIAATKSELKWSGGLGDAWTQRRQWRRGSAVYLRSDRPRHIFKTKCKKGHWNGEVRRHILTYSSLSLVLTNCNYALRSINVATDTTLRKLWNWVSQAAHAVKLPERLQIRWQLLTEAKLSSASYQELQVAVVHTWEHNRAGLAGRINYSDRSVAGY